MLLTMFHNVVLENAAHASCIQIEGAIHLIFGVMYDIYVYHLINIQI